MIILNTASLSSSTQRDARWQDMCAFRGTSAMLSVSHLSVFSDVVFLGLSLRVGSQQAAGSNTSFTVSHTWSARIPSDLRLASNEIMSAVVQLFFFFLQVQLIDTFVWLPKVQNTLPDVDLESARSHAKSESWKKTQPALWCSVSHIAVLSVTTFKIDVGNQSGQAFITGFVPLVIDPVRCFKDHIQALRTMVTTNFDSSPTVCNSSHLNWWSSKRRVET